MPSSDRSSKRRRSSRRTDGYSLRSIESLFTRQLLKVAGVLFLAASLWFAANSTDTILKIARNLLSPREIITSGKPSAVTPVSPAPEKKEEKPTTLPSLPVVLLLSATLVGWLGLQLLARWRKRAEFQVISVFLVFMVLLLLIRRYGWQVEFLFSLLIFITWGLWYFGHRLSHTGTRVNFLLTWGLFALWWLLKIMINAETRLLIPGFIFSSLMFLSFHVILLTGGFAGQRTVSRYFEAGAIGTNLLVYGVIMTATLLKFHGWNPLFFFLLALSLTYLASLLLMEWLRLPYRKIPFLISLMVLFSLLLPLLFRRNMIILLTGSLSFLLMVFSRETRDQPAVLISIGCMALMTLVFLKDVVLSYIPASFTGGLMNDTSLFYKGMVGGFFVPLVFYSNRKLFGKLEIKFPRRWFSRRRYMQLMKGIFLAGLYFGFFWVWQFGCLSLTGVSEIRFLSWFTFHCLFFSLAIPWLAAQRSSLLPIVVLVSAILTGIYPTLLSLQNLTLLDLYIRHLPTGIQGFPLHYIPAALFLVYVAVVLRFAGTAFKGSVIAKRLFLVYAVFMILFVLISEMILTGVAAVADSPLHASEVEAKLYRLPATFIMGTTALFLLGWGLIRQKRFTRTLALILLFLAAFKLIYYDLKYISLLNRVILLFFTGTLFFGIAISYARIRRTFRKRRPTRKRTYVSRFPGSGESQDQKPTS